MKKDKIILSSPTKYKIYLHLSLLLPAAAILLLAGCGSTPAGANPPATDLPLASPVASPALADAASPTVIPTPTTAAVAVEPVATEKDRLEVEKVSDSIRPSEPEFEPEIGEITFALDATETFQPVEANILFTKGITEIHAIFDYQHMSPHSTWERVWYLNDKEIARISEPWASAESGAFDYFIDNGGAPLPAGDWLLELYVEDELQALGVFVIEAEEQAVSDSSLLAYTKCNGDHHDIYVADIDGNNERFIVNNGAGPSWSPGGDAIFFYGESGIDRQVRDGLEYIFDGVSNGLAAVSTDPVPTTINQLNIFQNLEWKQGSARWANVSPDGSMIAYDAAPGGDYRIYFLGTESNQQFRYELLGEQADWSPDSQRVVYRSGRNGQTGLWISNRDDSGHILLTNHGTDAFPAWSPDGQTIAFSREDSGNVDIYSVNIDGSNLQRLTSTPSHDTLPTFTANGDIIFRTARTGKWAIWRMATDGSNPTEIVADACVGQEWAYSRMDAWP
ncbi:MAG: PD40 domain-containing protein [Anaerolineae bacterium]|nr:PD40 domain-containing protein [Anaerolineae bacterium]MCB0224077.1 PD40 domain-containing protein [Anaerolineae bacterium]MCB9108665.1 PD40 domain-containing protein [Anaerolineales bacterium]